jgi:hypothetical protein
MAASSDRDHVNQSPAIKAEPRMAVKQLPLHMLHTPKGSRQTDREPVPQSPPVKR